MARASSPWTLSNLARQRTNRRYEVLIGDHGSSDRTAELVDGWTGDSLDVRHIHVPWTAPNRSEVRNRLLDAARGEVVVFIDHDTLLPADAVETHFRLATAAHPTLAIGMTYGKGVFRGELGSKGLRRN